MKKNLFLKSASFVAFFTLISKISGFGVDSLIAYTYGPSFFNDLYVLIILIVTIIFIAVGNAVSTTFSPILSELIVNNSREEQNRFISNTVNISTVILLVLSFTGIIFSEQVVKLLAPGFLNDHSKGQLDTIIKSVQITFCSFILVGAQSVFIGVLNCYKSFKASSAVSIYNNVVLVIFLYFLHDDLGKLGLVYTIVIGYVISLSSLLIPLRKIGYRYIFVIDFRDEKIRKMLKRIVPVLIGSSVLQLNLVIDSMLASMIGVGAMSILNYASKLNILVTHVVGMAIATVMFPTLSEFAAKNNRNNFSSFLGKTVNMTNLLIIPITILIIILKEPVIRLLFERGQFSYKNTVQTAEILLCYSPAMIFMTLREILNRAFYSLHDTKTPMVISIIGVLINVALKFVFINSLGLAGIAIATSISVIIVTICQVYLLKSNGIVLVECYHIFFKVTLISFVLGITSHFLYQLVGGFYEDYTTFLEFINIGIVSCVFIGMYIILLSMLKVIKFENVRPYLNN